MKRAGYLALIVSLLVVWGCDLDNAEKAAPEGTMIAVSASPPRLPADGRSQAVVTAYVATDLGAVEDGTVVHFTASLGSIGEQAETRDGVARVRYTAGRLKGVDTIEAFSGLVSGQTEIELGQAASAITVTANPTTFTAPPDDQTHHYRSEIVATVWSAEGLPVEGAAVTFTTTLGQLESRGNVLHSDAQGRVIDGLLLDLKLSAGETAEASVTASCGSVSGTVVVKVKRPSE
jgi:hypothetical protein